MAMVDVVSGSLQADSQPWSFGLVWGRRPLGAILYSSYEPRELSQWLWAMTTALQTLSLLLLLLLMLLSCHAHHTVVLWVSYNSESILETKVLAGEGSNYLTTRTVSSCRSQQSVSLTFQTSTSALADVCMSTSAYRRSVLNPKSVIL